MQKKAYLQKDVSKKTGLKPQTIAFYSNRGLVPPSISPGTGRGSNRLYSTPDLILFELIKVLSDCGLSLEKIKAVLSTIKIHDAIKYALKHFDPNKSPALQINDRGNLVVDIDREPTYIGYIMRSENVHDIKKIDAVIQLEEKEIKMVSIKMIPKTTSYLLINVTNIFEKYVNL